MVRHFITLYKPLAQLVLSLLVFCCLLIGTATPGGLATKPVPTEPPWPLNCRLEISSTMCSLIY